MTAAVERFVKPALETWLSANKSVADRIIERIASATRARLASRDAAAKERKTAGSRGSICLGSLPTAR